MGARKVSSDDEGTWEIQLFFVSSMLFDSSCFERSTVTEVPGRLFSIIINLVSELNDFISRSFEEY